MSTDQTTTTCGWGDRCCGGDPAGCWQPGQEDERRKFEMYARTALLEAAKVREENDAVDPETTILKRLEDERIFSIERLTECDAFCIGEECDRHFTINLSRDELRQLAAEILEIANGT